MENASKALIIAGAILISILIIAIAMYIYSSASNNVSGTLAQMNSEQKQAFNNQFQSYQGQQSGTNVKALISKVMSNNKIYEDEPDEYLRVTVACTSAIGTGTGVQAVHDSSRETTYLSNIYNKVIAKKQYDVTIDIGDNGVVTGIRLQQK